MKGITLNDMIASLPQEEQDAIEQQYQDVRAEYLALQEIRKAAGMSQEQLAKALDMNQGNLSKLEKRTDIHISTLRRYVEALGGKLHIMAALPDKPIIELTSLSGRTESHSD